MRAAIAVTLFVVAFAGFMLGVVAPASGQTIPPPRPTELAPLTPYPTSTPNGCDGPGCIVPTATPATPYPTSTPGGGCPDYCSPPPTNTPAVPTPDRPPAEPTSEVQSAFPGMKEHYNYMVFCVKIGKDGQ